MALSAEQWLDRLTRRLDQRRARVDLLRSYMDGNAPLPEGAEGCREAYQQFQRKARTNYGELVVDAVADRMVVSGFRVGDERTDDNAARAAWKRSHMDVGAGDVHRDMLGVRSSYVMVSPTDDGPVMTYERPEQVITERDPLLPHVQRAGVKVYRDEIAGVDEAFLHLPGVVLTYRRDPANTNPFTTTEPGAPVRTTNGGWTPVGGIYTDLDVIPIIPFDNRKCLGEFETHLDVLDRINWTILQRLVITAMQAYRQRATKGDLDETDEAGNVIDYAEMFKPGPGALWQLPEGVELQELGQAELTGILSSAKDDLTTFAAVTRTPMATLMPDSANQTAEGASFAKEGLVFKAEDRIKRAGASWSLAQGIAWALASGQRKPRTDISTLWLPPDRSSLAERADAASKASDMPWRWRAERIWQVPADEIDRLESERAADALLNAATAPVQPQPAAPVAQPGEHDDGN